MVSWPRARRVLGLGLPIVGGMLSQNLLDLVDTAMVGQLGPAALAGVGIASFANFMTVALLIGLGAGVQALVARRLGEGRVGEAAIPLNGGLALALVFGIPISALVFWASPVLFPLLASAPEVVAEGLPYWQARLVGGVAIALNFSFRGYWNGIGETRTYLQVIVTVHVINVVVSYVLIFGALGIPALGTVGAGIGTTVSLFCGTLIYFVLTHRRGRREHGFLERLPRGQTMRSLLSLSIPSALQTLLFATGFTLFFWIIAQIGTDELAISNVLLNLVKVAALPALGLGMASMSLVSGALGRREPEDAARWAWDTVWIASLILSVVAATLLIFPETILGLFLVDPEVREMARLPLFLVAATLMVEAFVNVLSSAMTGAGAARQALIVQVVSQWAIGLPLAYLFGVTLGGGLVAVWLGQMGYRMLAAAAFVVLWRRGAWKTIEI